MVELNYEWLREYGSNIRVHGNRFIQIDVGGFERVHLWSDMVPTAQEFPTWIHDHVFGFHSNVLAGTLIDVRYRTEVREPSAMLPKGEHLYAVYTAVPREGSDTQLSRTNELRKVEISSLAAVREGEGYLMSPGEFHASSYVGYAITHLRKMEIRRDLSPRVLCPVSASPDNEFERYKYPAELLWRVARGIISIAEREGVKR